MSVRSLELTRKLAVRPTLPAPLVANECDLDHSALTKGSVPWTWTEDKAIHCVAADNAAPTLVTAHPRILNFKTTLFVIPTGWPVGFRLVGRLVSGWFAGWSVGLLLAGWLPRWLAGWLADLLARRLVSSWFAGWLVGFRLVCRLVN